MHGLTDPREPFFKDGGWGWTGTRWRRLQMTWGYSAIWDEDFAGVATDTSYTAAASVIPAGEVWVLQAASLRNKTGTSANALIFVERGSGASVAIESVLALAQWIPILATGMFALVTGDRLKIYLGSIQVDDALEGGVIGYKMKIAE